MKLYLFIIALVCHQIVSAQPGAWTVVTPAEFHDNPQIRELLLFGIQEFTQEEIHADKLPEATYEYDHIYLIYEQVVNGMNYRFDADIGNDQGWVIRATWIVNSQGNDTRELVSYVYEVVSNPNNAEEGELILSEEDNLAGGWSPIDPAELNTNDRLENALHFGVQSVTDQAVIDHNLPESEYEVAEVHSIEGQVVNGMNYRFDVSIENCAGLVANAVFTVYSPPDESAEMEATLESLDIVRIPRGGLIGGECSNGEGETELGEEEMGEQ